MVDTSRILGRLFAAAGRRPAWLRYGMAIVLPVLALALVFLAVDFSRVSSVNLFLFAPALSLFLLTTIFVAILGGTRPGLVATAMGILLACVLAPPVPSLAVADSEHIIRIVLFAILGSLLSILIGSAGRLQQKFDVERGRLEVTLRSIGDAVIATDVRGRITFMNPAAERATGWKSSEAEGRNLNEVFRIINEQTRVAAENPVQRVLRAGKAIGLANHTLLIRKDGSEIPIEDSAAPILNRGVKNGVVLVFRDVTNSRRRQAAMLRTEKLASVGRLASTIAHEINNPLEAVSNLLYLIKVSQDLSEIRNFVVIAEQELARASHVARQSLSLSRQSGVLESVSLPEMVDNIALLYMNRMQARAISLNRRYRGDGQAFGVRHDFGQVISNLLSNAIDAENQGGRIDIRVADRADQRAVHLTVADRGCGMSHEQLGRLYEPFFTTKESLGTGLGMWLTKEILDGAGGRIRVRSRPQRGTVFRITWPAATDQRPEDPTAEI